MARPAGINVLELDVEKAQGFGVKLWERAARSVAGEMEEWAQRHSSRPNPTGKNPSKPGQYPKLVSGEFVDGIRFVYSREAKAIRAYTRAKHGVFLQEGTPNMEKRDWATKTMEAKNWLARVATVARAFNK